MFNCSVSSQSRAAFRYSDGHRLATYLSLNAADSTGRLQFPVLCGYHLLEICALFLQVLVTAVIARLVLMLAGDIERNPGPISKDSKPALRDLQCISYTSDGDGSTVYFRLMDRIKPRLSNLAIALGFPQHIIDDLRTKEKPVQYMLGEWLKGGIQEHDKRPLTWETLITALREANMSEEVDVLNRVIITVSVTVRLETADPQNGTQDEVLQFELARSSKEDNVSQTGASTSCSTVDLVMELEGESFNLLDIPDSSSALVKRCEDIALAGVDLDSLVIDLSMVGKFTRIAYNGVAGYTDLQIKIRRIEINVSKLCDKSAITVGKFLQTSEAILVDLQTTYQYLIDGMEDMAIDTLKSTTTVAKGMAEAAEKLATAFDEEAERVKEVIEDTQRTHNSAIEEKKHEEELAEKHQQDKVKAERKQAELEEQLAQHEQEYDEIVAKQAQNEKSRGFILDIMDSLTGKSAAMARIAVQEKEMHLKEMRELRDKRSKVIQDYYQFSLEIKKCGENGELLETAIPSLYEAMGGLKLLSDVMRKISCFWTRMEMECKELGSEHIVSQIQTAMKRPKASRLEVWGSIGFKTRAIRYYARWVALGNICGQYVERVKETQREFCVQLKENLTRDEAKQNVKELADNFANELEGIQNVMEDKQAKDQSSDDN